MTVASLTSKRRMGPPHAPRLEEQRTGVENQAVTKQTVTKQTGGAVLPRAWATRIARRTGEIAGVGPAGTGHVGFGAAAPAVEGFGIARTDRFAVP
jgi:hypothetical protein